MERTSHRCLRGQDEKRRQRPDAQRRFDECPLASGQRHLVSEQHRDQHGGDVANGNDADDQADPSGVNQRADEDHQQDGEQLEGRLDARCLPAPVFRHDIGDEPLQRALCEVR
jgi:hypothetical protein